MTIARKLRITALLAVLTLATVSVQAADHPAPQEGEWIVEDFQFESGETLPELRLNYRTVGDPSGMPVLLLHGTTGSGAYFLGESLAGELFGPGQPLDAENHYLIMTDALGAGSSSKPSDGLRTQFPNYAYEDLVRAQYRLLTEHLGLTHLRLVIGNSAGGMQVWVWGTMYPDFMDALVPMAALPIPMSGRNWMMRRMLIDGIRNDPDYNGGNYTSQPQAWPNVLTYFRLATSGGTRAVYQSNATREATDRSIAASLAAGTPLDANDVVYAYMASRDYDPSPDLEDIQAALLAVVAEDDERNPAELGVLEREISRIPNGRYFIIPASDTTRGHGTTRQAVLWKNALATLLETAPVRSK